MYQCYRAPTVLFYGDYRISSEVGVQQGDPSGPLIFSEAIHPIIEALKSELNIWFLDDGTLVGDIETVRHDLMIIEQKFKEMGLEVNINKCELFVLNEDIHDDKTFFENAFPGLKIVQTLTLLGSPITMTAVDVIFDKKIRSLELMFNRLELLNNHVAYFILKHCLGIPKLIFLLRTTPMWKFPEIVKRIDNLMKLTIERICNIRLDDYQYSVSSLPCRQGGLGIRKVSDIMLPSFLSSICSTSSLINQILSGNTSDLVEIAHYGEGLDEWEIENNKFPDVPANQRSWDKINSERIIESLNFPSDKHKARFIASSTKEASLWLSTLPSKNIGTLLDNNTFRISVALRIGAQMCHQYECLCGETVDIYGTHALKCKKSAGRYARHREMNNIIHRTMSSANIPSTLEPKGLFRDDGKKLDGMTLAPWEKGACLVWDATCVDTLADSYIKSTTNKAGSAAETAAKRKLNKYKAIREKNFLIVPFAVETLGSWGKDAILFADKLGDMLNSVSGEARSKEFFKKNISLAIQRGNAASIMGSYRIERDFNEIFYIL